MKDSESRRFNYSNSSSDSKPMMMKLEGVQIPIFALSLLFAVIFFNLLFKMGAGVVFCLGGSGAFPILTLAFIHTFMRGKPSGYFIHWVRSARLKSTRESLLKIKTK